MSMTSNIIGLALLAAELLLIVGPLIGLSIAMYLLLKRVMWRALAAVLGPLLAMLVGWLYAWIRVLTIRPDGDATDVLILLPPFVLGLILPIIAGLLLWVLATRGRAARRRALHHA